VVPVIQSKILKQTSIFSSKSKSSIPYVLKFIFNGNFYLERVRKKLRKKGHFCSSLCWCFIAGKLLKVFEPAYAAYVRAT
jgi:hypothetical protein